MKLNLLPLCAVLMLAASFSNAAVPGTDAGHPAAKSAPIPMEQIGAVAGKQYQGDGLSVTATPEGARLRCAFQKLEGQATREGLWLISTTEGANGERFRVVASAVGRSAGIPAGEEKLLRTTTPIKMSALLPDTGQVTVSDQTARFIRPSVTEEYSVSVDGVRQDFVVTARPEGAGQLRVELDVSGAKAEPLANGARLTLDGSGRKIAYSRLRVVDATGKELAGRMEVVAAGIMPAVEGALPAARTTPANTPTALLQTTPASAGLEAPALRQALMPAATMLAVLVDDAGAVYPLRIDPTFTDANWISMGGLAGTDGTISAAVVDEAGNLYIGGSFYVVGNLMANGVAKWDGTAWSALNGGVSGGTIPSVGALAVSGTNLYAGGSFTNAGGIMAAHIARWDGSTWAALGSGLNGTVNALAISGTNVYASGYFADVNGAMTYQIACWNGIAWTTLGPGLNGPVAALAISGTNLYAGGSFTRAGNNDATNIAKWNGSTWTALGSGVDGPIRTLMQVGTNLYAGGDFSFAGGNYATGVAIWNETAWSASCCWFYPSGQLFPQHIDSFTKFGTNVYAAGYFMTSSGSSFHYLAKQDGTNWQALYPGAIGAVFAMAISGNILYVGGAFDVAGGNAAKNIAQWNGSTFAPLGSGMGRDFTINALAIIGTNLYAGGSFTMVGESTASYVARWNGRTWSALGSGVDGLVYALAVSGTNLYVGGYFTNAGGSQVNYIASWNGNTWAALGSGANAPVTCLAVSGMNLYAAGFFTKAGEALASHVARWDGNSWSALGAGVNSNVFALAVSGSKVYVGGQFTTAGESGATNVAQWNGASWSRMGTGIRDPLYHSVNALAVSGQDVYVGGYFWDAGDLRVHSVAKWNGISWSWLGPGLALEDRTVYSLAVSGTDVYVGGDFTKAGFVPANRIARWDGSDWSALGSGVASANGSAPYVTALAVSGSDLYVGGSFTVAGGKASAHVARVALNPPNLGGFTRSLQGPFEFGFTNNPGGTFGVLASTNTALPTSNWTILGPITEDTNFPGRYQFSDPEATNIPQRFYRVVAP